MAQTFVELATTLKASGKLTDANTLAVRQLLWSDSVIQPEEADALFDLNTACADRSVAWADFFVDAICHYVVHQRDPKGYVSDDNAAWLMARIDCDGKIESLAEFDVLVRILETAKNAPESLKAYALNQIEQTVLSGAGPTRLSGNIQPGRIDEAEVILLRRLLFASASDGNIIVSEAEADLLFRLKDATLTAENAVEWKTLFVQCVANHLMAHALYVPISRADEQQHEAWIADTKTSARSFLGRMLSKESISLAARLTRRQETASRLAAREETAAEHDAAVAASAAITAEEAAWLKAKISVDDDVDELEKALLAFIVDEKVTLPESLADLQRFA